MTNFCTFVANFIGYFVLFQLCLLCEAQFPAYRICKPGPALPYPNVNSTLKNCLILGDSVSIGYTPHVAEMLSDVCQVQHAPWDTSDGGALDTKYAMECISLFLSTAEGKATHYDAIIFNSGLHDIQYCPGMYPEEYVPYKEYLSNIMVLAERLEQTGAKIGFVSSTPVPYDVQRNNRVKQYNGGVKDILNSTTVTFFDLYEKVVDICGEPPFNSCFIMGEQPNVHYNGDGYTYLGVFVSKLFTTLLGREDEDEGDHSGKDKIETENIDWHLEKNLDEPWRICQEGKFTSKQELMKSYFETPAVRSSCGRKHSKRSLWSDKLKTTACPSSMTCSWSTYSGTGIGCCPIPNANVCADGLYCCPRGMRCAEDCGQGTVICSCVAQTSRKQKQQRKRDWKQKERNSKLIESLIH